MQSDKMHKNDKNINVSTMNLTEKTMNETVFSSMVAHHEDCEENDNNMIYISDFDEKNHKSHGG